MTHEVLVTGEARRDIRTIELYFAARGNRAGFDAFLNRFAAEVADLAEHPAAHRPSHLPELADMGYRRFRCGRHLALYRIVGTKVYIEHVFHKAQDYARLV